MNDGNKIPALGLGLSASIHYLHGVYLPSELQITRALGGSGLFGVGTWQFKPDEAVNAVAHALKNGYRHIDCAW